jgi:hypothetical protein
MPEPPASVDALIADCPPVGEAYDTSTDEFAAYVDRVERELGADRPELLVELDRDPAARAPDALGFRVALKVVESRAAVRSLSEPVVVTLINPVYKETGRLQPRERHPHGEDSIRYKAAALDRISRLNPDVVTRLVVIDDGCPDGSGEMAAEILADVPGWEGRYEVLFLEEARRRGDPDVPPGLTAKDGDRRSVKGGAVLYGMRRALRLDTDRRHVIVDNDADLSILPDQLGLLLRGIVDDGLGVVAGSRREADSVALIGSSRAARGSLFISIWQHLLPELAGSIIDTNRAFKAFDAPALAGIIDDVETYTFPYQVEVLQAAVTRGVPLAPQAVAYIDSEAASTQQGEAITETYLDQVRQIADIAQRYGTIPPDDPLLEFLAEVDEESWARIEQDPPPELLDILAG